jgi:hypothetical protein
MGNEKKNSANASKHGRHQSGTAQALTASLSDFAETVTLNTCEETESD